MKTITEIISLMIISPVLFAADMNASLKLYDPISVSVDTHMKLPSVYTTDTGDIDSEDATSVPGGDDGVNAILIVSGNPSTQYSLIMDPTVVISNNSSNINVILTVVGGATHRMLSGGGLDNPMIIGSATLNGSQVEGTYEGNLEITASYDEV